jgi:hypothetical protein
MLAPLGQNGVTATAWRAHRPKPSTIADVSTGPALPQASLFTGAVMREPMRSKMGLLRRKRLDWMINGYPLVPRGLRPVARA